MKRKVEKYILGEDTNPLLLSGDALEVLKSIPDNSIDCCMTSPPYWQKREYANGGIGLEKKYEEYIDNLVAICMEVHRVLKLTGSFWLNIGDSYKNKCLLNIPWRVAIELTDRGWILRNTIIWNKVKGGMDNSKDRLGPAPDCNLSLRCTSLYLAWLNTDPHHGSMGIITGLGASTGTGVEGEAIPDLSSSVMFSCQLAGGTMTSSPGLMGSLSLLSKSVLRFT